MATPFIEPPLWKTESYFPILQHFPSLNLISSDLLSSICMVDVSVLFISFPTESLIKNEVQKNHVIRSMCGKALRLLFLKILKRVSKAVCCDVGMGGSRYWRGSEEEEQNSPFIKPRTNLTRLKLSCHVPIFLADKQLESLPKGLSPNRDSEFCEICAKHIQPLFWGANQLCTDTNKM